RGFDRRMERRRCGGHARVAHDRFCKGFRRFDSRRCLSGSKNLSPILAEEIYDSKFEWRLWSDDCEIDVGALGESRETSDISGFDENAIADLGDAGITWSTNQLNRWIISEEFPR